MDRDQINPSEADDSLLEYNRGIDYFNPINNLSFSSQFGRLITAAITPFADDLSVDEQSLQTLWKRLIEHNTTAVVVAGTTGEKPTLTHDEDFKLLISANEHLAGKLPVIFGAGSNCTATTCEVVQRAQQLGADGLMIVTPYYNKPNQSGLYAHYKAVAECTTLPMLIYNNPGRTACYLEPETIAELNSVYPHIAAVKDSSGNFDALSKLRALAPAFEIYSGDDSTILPVMSIGGVGVVSVASQVIGKPIAEMIESFLSGDVRAAAAMHAKLFPMFKALFASPSPGPVKYLLARLNICKANLRLPLTLPDAETCATLDKLMQILSVN